MLTSTDPSAAAQPGAGPDPTEPDLVGDSTDPTDLTDSTDPTERTEGASFPDELVRRLDALSLQQALIDFELANARVLDLTARLVEATNASVRRQAELDAMHATISGVRTELAEALEKARVATAAAGVAQGALTAIESSPTYRVVRAVGRVRRLFGHR